MEKIDSHQYTLWVFSGVLTGSALLSPFFWILVFLGLFLQLYLLYSQKVSNKTVLIGATLAGTVHMLFSLSWGWSVVPLEWLGVSSGAVQSLFILSVWVLSALVIGFGYGGALFVLRYVTQRHWSLLVFFPFAVLAGEVLGRMLFSIGSISVDVGLSTSFGFGHMGYVLVEHGVLRGIAAFGGVYILSFVVGILAVLIYVASQYFGKTKIRKITLGIFGIVVLYGSAFAYVPFQDDTQIPENVALLSTQFSMEFDRSVEGTQMIEAMHKLAVQQALNQGNSTVIMPEDARYLASLDQAELEGLSGNLSQEVLIIDSSSKQRDGKTVLSAILYNSVTKETYTYDKQHLVPFGEQLPIVYGLFMKLVGLSDAVQYLQNNFEYRVGVTKQGSETPTELPAVLFCYESLVPYMTHSLVDEQTPFVAHVVSQAWFDDSSNALKNQLSAMLRVQAVWNDTYILQSANMSPSAVYTPAGDVYFSPSVEDDLLWRVDSAQDIVAGGRTRL